MNITKEKLEATIAALVETVRNEPRSNSHALIDAMAQSRLFNATCTAAIKTVTELLIGTKDEGEFLAVIGGYCEAWLRAGYAMGQADAMNNLLNLEDNNDAKDHKNNERGE